MQIANQERSLDVITSEIILIRDNTARTIRQGIIDIGRRLEEAKEQVPQGEWLNYLENVLGFKPSTAQNYMRIAREVGDGQIGFDGKSPMELFGDLGYSQIVPLLGLPEAARKEIAENNNLAEMSSREIKKLTEDYKKAQAAEKIAADRAQKAEELAQKAEKAAKKAEKALKEQEHAYQAVEDRNKELTGQVADLMERLKEKPIEVEAEVIPDEKLLERARNEIRQEVQQQIEESNRRAQVAQEQLEKAKNPAVHQVNFLFSELQDVADKLQTALNGLGVSSPEIAQKFGGAIFDWMRSTCDKFERM